MNTKDKNSHFNKNSIQAEEMKLKTKNKTEYMEFCTTITINELKINILEKI